MATHSSILTWKIPCTEEAGRLQSIGLQESDRIEHLSPTATVQHSQPDYGDLGKQR